MRPPRGRTRRLALTSVLGILLLLGPIVLADTLLYDPSAVVSEAEGFSLDWTQIVALAVQLPILAAIAPRVSYRWFDCLFLLVPVYGVFWVFKVLWRLTYLPYRDWPPRADEVGRVTSVEGLDGRIYLKA
jgi:hypothetical protein